MARTLYKRSRPVRVKHANTPRNTGTHTEAPKQCRLRKHCVYDSRTTTTLSPGAEHHQPPSATDAGRQVHAVAHCLPGRQTPPAETFRNVSLAGAAARTYSRFRYRFCSIFQFLILRILRIHIERETPAAYMKTIPKHER